MAYSRKRPNAFPNYLFNVTNGCQATPDPREVEIVVADRATAVNQRWKINEFRAALRTEGSIAMYPAFDRAQVLIRPAPETSATAWKIILRDPEAGGPNPLQELGNRLVRDAIAKGRLLPPADPTPPPNYLDNIPLCNSNPPIDDVLAEMFGGPLSTETEAPAPGGKDKPSSGG